MKSFRAFAFLTFLMASTLAVTDARAAADPCSAWFPGNCDCQYSGNTVNITCDSTWGFCEDWYPTFCDDLATRCIEYCTDESCGMAYISSCDASTMIECVGTCYCDFCNK